KFADDFVPGIADGKTPGAGRADGGAAESFNPNLAIDLIFESRRREDGKSVICEVSSNGSAIDEKGNSIESARIGIYATLRMTEDPWGDNRGTILLKQGAPGAQMLRELHGELLIGPGRLLHFTFPGEDLRKPITRKDGDKVVRFDGLRKEEDRIHVNASVSGPSLPKDWFNPGAAFRTMAQSAAVPDLVIVGSDGRTRLPKQFSGGGGTSQGIGTGFGQGSGSGGGTGAGFGFGRSSSSSKGRAKKPETGRESTGEG